MLVDSDSTQPKFVAIESISIIIFSVFYFFASSFSINSDFPTNIILANNSCSFISPIMINNFDNNLSSTPFDMFFSSNILILTLLFFYFFIFPIFQLDIPRSSLFDNINMIKLLDQYSNIYHNYHISEK